MIINNFTSNSFILSWPGYDSDFQSAFIEGYRVYLKSKEMQCHPKGKRTSLSGDACFCHLDLSHHSESNEIDAESALELGKSMNRSLCDQARLGTRPGTRLMLHIILESIGKQKGCEYRKWYFNSLQK